LKKKLIKRKKNKSKGLKILFKKTGQSQVLDLKLKAKSLDK
jgi:hypothetical protein